MDRYHLTAHIMAFAVSLVWGVTFVNSKIVLQYYTPAEVLILRFLLAYILLWIIYPKNHKFKLKDELLYLTAGISGVTMYFILENSALLYSTASNVGIILASVPIVVALISHFFLEDEHFHRNLFFGFIVTICGVGLVILNGQINLHLNPLGDILALLCCLVWGVYTLVIKKMDTKVSNFSEQEGSSCTVSLQPYSISLLLMVSPISGIF